MNRETWRDVKRMNWQEAERAIKAIYDPAIEEAKVFAYKNAFASVFTALYDRFPGLMTGDMLHSIAVDTIEYTEGIEPPEELIEALYQKTGFDIRLRTDQQPQQYIPKASAERCDCWHPDDYGEDRCWGTKERDTCNCGGYKAICNYYKWVGGANGD